MPLSLHEMWVITRLGKLFRGKMRAGLRQMKLETGAAPAVWGKAWVVDCRAVGSGGLGSLTHSVRERYWERHVSGPDVTPVLT